MRTSCSGFKALLEIIKPFSKTWNDYMKHKAVRDQGLGYDMQEF